MGSERIRFKKHIRRESRVEANRLKEEYGIQDSGGLSWLSIFADADTEERNCQEIVKREGIVIKDRFGQKRSHPLLTVIRDARAQKMMALRNLNLDVEPLKNGPGRPTGGLT